ncbi:triose-phosphate isomerase [Candidatus Woesearchaeota archaeon]|nr:triose-phosphate isomerase [Candidatus Woesearchaeota archaeon]
MKTPCIVVNCKAYEKGTGRHAVELARVAVRVSRECGVTVALAVQPQDIPRVSATGVVTFAQHVDPIVFGAHTGHVLPVGVREAGAVGTLLNHSEKRLSVLSLQKSLSAARSAGLQVVVCARSPAVAQKIAPLAPDMIAVEPPELIGGDVAVSQAKPQVITQTTNSIKNIPILCGAGIKTAEDVRKALELGARGILVASGVVNAPDPAQVLKSFAHEFCEFGRCASSFSKIRKF